MTQKQRYVLTDQEIGHGACISGFLAWMRRESACVPNTSDEMNALIMRYLAFDRTASPTDWKEVLQHFMTETN